MPTGRQDKKRPRFGGVSFYGALRAFYGSHRFNNPALRAELISRTRLGNKVFDFERIHGLSPEPIESVAVFEVENGLIKTAWFYFPS